MPINTAQPQSSPTKPTKVRAKPIFSIGGGVSQKERMFFTEQLSLSLSTGNSIVDSLKAIKTQIKSIEFGKMVDSLIDELENGKTFSQALSRFPSTFSKSYVQLVQASEAGGFLAKALDKLADFEHKRDELHNSIVSMMIYPCFLMLFSVGVVVFILVEIFPKFEDMFTPIMDKLPLSTQVLMKLSDVMLTHWNMILVSVVVLMLGLFWMLRSDHLQQVIDSAKMKTVVINQLFIKIYLIQMMRVLGMSLTHGVPIVDALNSCKDLVKNRIFTQFLSDLENRILEGQSLAVALGTTAFVPEIVKQMIKTGENSGSLAPVMERIVEYYEKELAKTIKIFSKSIEPIMLVVMGLVVGTIVASLILPIFKLSTSAH